MNLDLIFAVIFYGIIYFLFLKYRNKFEVQNKVFVLFKTKFGIKAMDNIAKKYPRLLNFLSYISILLGFAGMIFIFYILVKGTLNLILKPAAPPVLSPVLPGVSIPGLPTLSFWHWIISILIVAIVHEFCHGIYSRLADIKIKSSGFAFLGPILAAFVEPDEKQMAKKSTKKQLAVLSAGPFSNILIGFAILAISIFILSPIASSLVVPQGIKIVEISQDFPLSKTNIKSGEIMESINNIQINNQSDFVRILNSFKPGDTITIKTDKILANATLTTNPKNSSAPYLGVLVSQNKLEISPTINKNYAFAVDAFLWFMTLMFWLYIINIGVGLFNLLPLGPVDGGRMFYVAALAIFKNKKTAQKMFSLATLICLILIFINLLPYLVKLITFILTPIFALI